LVIFHSETPLPSNRGESAEDDPAGSSSNRGVGSSDDAKV
jgi:hypothetical protein